MTHGAHGAQTCPSCGGYLVPLWDQKDKVWQQCRQCGDTSAVAKKNNLDDFMNATAYDYDEN